MSYPDTIAKQEENLKGNSLKNIRKGQTMWFFLNLEPDMLQKIVMDGGFDHERELFKKLFC